MRHKAFVASTFGDLKHHRSHVINVLPRSGFHVDPMEDWTATADEPRTFCAERLDGCDLCVLLVARRRGFVPEGGTKSITELEYDHAVSTGVSVLPFMSDNEADWPREPEALSVDPGLLEWRRLLMLRHGVAFFGPDPSPLTLRRH